MTPTLTLEPLSRAHLPEAAALWANPAVIRYTNITAPCTPAEAAERLDRLLDCQRELPSPTIYAIRERAAFRGLAGCPPVDAAAAGTYGLFYQLLPACWGRGVGFAAGLRRPCGSWSGCPCPWCWQMWWRRTPPASAFWSTWGLSARRSAPAHSAGRGGGWISGIMSVGLAAGPERHPGRIHAFCGEDTPTTMEK